MDSLHNKDVGLFCDNYNVFLYLKINGIMSC